MMVGFHEPTSGDAQVFGHSISSSISEVQKIMGVRDLNPLMLGLSPI